MLPWRARGPENSIKTQHQDDLITFSFCPSISLLFTILHAPSSCYKFESLSLSLSTLCMIGLMAVSVSARISQSWFIEIILFSLHTQISPRQTVRHSMLTNSQTTLRGELTHNALTLRVSRISYGADSLDNTCSNDFSGTSVYSKTLSSMDPPLRCARVMGLLGES